MPDAREDGSLVLPRTRELTAQLAPGVGLDQPAKGFGVAGIVHSDTKTIALLVDLLEHLHGRFVELRDASHRRQGVDTRSGRQREQVRHGGRIVANVDLDLVAGRENHLADLTLCFALNCAHRVKASRHAGRRIHRPELLPGGVALHLRLARQEPRQRDCGNDEHDVRHK